MSDLLIALLLTVGAVFALIAAIGIVRMPDFFMRLSATTKASTLGASFILCATAFYFKDAAITGKILAIIAFTVLTAPVAAHMIGRAAWLSGVKLWDATVCDHLRDAVKSDQVDSSLP